MLPKVKDLKKAQLSMSQEISMISSFVIGKLKTLLFLVMAMLLIIVLNSKNSYVNSAHNQAMSRVAALYQVLNEPINWLNHVRAKTKDIFDAAKKIPELMIENENLKKQIASLEGAVEELNRLRVLMNVVDHSMFSPITARVVSENFQNTESKFLINAGSDDGIAEGMAVINQSGFIGRVVEVAKKSARVMTIRDEQSSIPAIAKPSNKRFIISGGFGPADNIAIKYVDGGVVPAGDCVQTSNDGDLIPSGINIGIISENGKSLVPNFKLEDLDRVLVLKPN